jgi:hypothetical protein
VTVLKQPFLHGSARQCPACAAELRPRRIDGHVPCTMPSTMTKSALTLLLLAVATFAPVAGVGCAQKRTNAKSVTTKPTTVTLPPLAGEGESNEAAPDQGKRPRFGQSTVYVDGKSVGVVRFSELPVGVKGVPHHLGGGFYSTRYSVGEYLRALHVDMAKVRAVHLYGGRRVAVLDKAEFARIGDRVVLSFTQGDRGKPRVHFPSIPIKVNTTVDMLTNIAVYVDKQPPTLKDGDLVMPDGTVIDEKVPYAPEEQGNGTRVYIDGTLVGTVKRKRLTSEMLLKAPAPDQGSAKIVAPTNDDHYSVLAYAGMLRADAKQAKAVDLIAGDDVVARVEDVSSLSFNVPQRNRGQAVVDVPTRGATRQARISAIQIYVHTQPPARSVVDLDAAPEAALGSGRGHGGGPDEEL